MNSQDPTFVSIAEISLNSKHSIARIASAIELKGFYTWDKLGRFIYVSPDKSVHKKLCNHLLNILSEITEGGNDFDVDFFNTSSKKLTYLEQCGWLDSDLPDFEALETEWNQKYLGKIKPISKKTKENSDPATQSKIWNVLEGLVKLHFKQTIPDIIEDLKSNHSDYASVVCEKLQTVDVDVDPKTFKTYFKKKG